MVDSTRVFAAMQNETPHKTFKKVVISKVALNVINPFTREPEVLILEGDPNKNDPNCFLDVWSTEELMFVKKMNKSLFDKGFILEVEREEVKGPTETELLNAASDETLYNILNSKWLALVASLNKITSIVTLQRLLTMAKEEDKSEKTIDAIRARMFEVESG